MINTKENTIEETEILEIKTFPSLKNNCFFEYVMPFEEAMMILCEADRSIIKYEPFIFKMVNINTHEIEKFPALVTESDEGLLYIILSDQLAANQKWGGAIRHQLQQFQSLPVYVALTATGYLTTDPLPLNLKFLYEFAILPIEKKAFAKIQKILASVSQISIGKLKKRVDVISIYQLLFHCALHTDLENELINDDTIVTASPIINSIIKSL
ncbi:MAG: hypothetical protein LUM44_07660 [Pyrinomonadaceae bacterium]|nr:hypothetical protein [Pyrinomonadaceae bacterium]